MVQGNPGKHSAPQTQSHAVEPKRSHTALKVIIGVLVVAALCGAGYAGFNYYQQVQASSKTTEPIVPDQSATASDAASASTSSSSTDATPAVTRVNNPIDFDSLQQENPDIVGWISVPDTKVNYPVMRSASDDGFYLNHDENGNTTVAGAIYMEMANNPQFLDYVTVLYGHCLQTDAMFTTLHYFEDATFFNDHPTFYIYIKEHIYTYTIISAFNYDDRHILNSFKFNDPAVRLQYYAMLQNPESLVVQKRAGLNLTADSKIVQLSTCLSGYSYDNQRYIVSGVLTNDQITY